MGDHTASAIAVSLLAVVSIALTATPALAQDYRFAAFDAPGGATATANVQVPLGRRPKPTYGLSIGYGHTVGAQSLDGRTQTRRIDIADLRFDGSGKVARAELVTFNLADLENDPRMKLNEDGSPGTLLIVGGVVVVSVLALLLIAGGNDTCKPENCLF